MLPTLLNASSIIDETSSDSYLDVYNMHEIEKTSKETLNQIRQKLDSQRIRNIRIVKSVKISISRCRGHRTPYRITRP